MRFIFDLDHTVINSSHRQATLPNGDLNLQHWRENATPEKIAQDSLLPLADEWKKARAKGSEIIVCTARVMSQPDYDFLRNNGLEYDAILSRPAGNMTADAVLKYFQLYHYATRIRGKSWKNFCAFSTMFDDNENVIKRLRFHGLRVYNAVEINRRLAA